MKKIKIKLGESGSFGWVFWFSGSLIWHMLWFFFSQPNNNEQIFLSINNLDVSGIMAWVNITKKLPPTKNFVQTVWCITSYVVNQIEDLYSHCLQAFLLRKYTSFLFPVFLIQAKCHGKIKIATVQIIVFPTLSGFVSRLVFVERWIYKATKTKKSNELRYILKNLAQIGICSKKMLRVWMTVIKNYCYIQPTITAETYVTCSSGTDFNGNPTDLTRGVLDLDVTYCEWYMSSGGKLIEIVFRFCRRTLSCSCFRVVLRT